jgi:predicted Fe-Mo cluster-binding NifX family protein
MERLFRNWNHRSLMLVPLIPSNSITYRKYDQYSFGTVNALLISMKIAIPIFQNMIAPRFCYATSFAVFELDSDGESKRVQDLNLLGCDWVDKLDRLTESGVGVLLCSGFNRSFLPKAESVGIEVVAGLAGAPEEIVRALFEQRLDDFLVGPRGKGFGRCRQSGNTYQRGSNEPERIVMPNRDGTGPVGGQGRGSGQGKGACGTGQGRGQNSGAGTGQGRGQGRGTGGGQGSGGGQGKGGGGGNRSGRGGQRQGQ